MRRAFTFIALFMLVAGVAPAPLESQDSSSHAIGTVRFSTSCSAQAQPQFNRSVALLHSFAFAQSTEAFNAVLRTDPACTMAWWGIALSAWGNPFAAGIKSPAIMGRGLDAIRKGRATGTPTARESRYLEAAARLYEHAESLPQLARMVAYRDAMGDLAKREPADTEAVIFHALALAFSADPTDKTFANQLAAGAALERLFARLPDHPGLAHYIIHAYDVPALASRAMNAANRYAHIAPEASHALHMPSHTYTRAGLWQQSIDANIASAVAAKREGTTAEELHSMDYRAYASLQMARDSDAHELLSVLPTVVGRFDPTKPGGAAPPAAGFYAMAAIPARYALERGQWREAASLPVNASPVAFANSLTWFARGLGAARTNNLAVADSAIAELQNIRDRLTQAHEDYWNEQSEIQRRAVVAWRDFAAGRRTEGLAEMREAANREDATDKNALTPGPLAPARELLGDMLLEAHEPAKALIAYETTLKHEPNRFRALAGAVMAAKTAGKPAQARRHFQALLALSAHAQPPLRREITEAKRALQVP